MDITVSPNSMRAALLATIVVYAAWCDVRTRRIPNALTLGSALAGLMLAAVGFADGPSFGSAVGGAMLGLALLLPLYAVRALGAGDAKLMAAVGAFAGAPAMVFIFLLTGIAGGIAALALATRRRMLGRLAANARDLLHLEFAAVNSVGRLPYGVCICAGTLAWLALRQWR
ncbi:MAG TPA: A24 family peptidase [Ramlibacter sp.]|jgi:prepilin peptidase CpaA|nr:A24 family peptidase [Ramlibacter sp.]